MTTEYERGYADAISTLPRLTEEEIASLIKEAAAYPITADHFNKHSMDELYAEIGKRAARDLIAKLPHIVKES